MKKSFLEYSMSVIVSRALPDVRDGLKPVHRRILYTMFENGLFPEKEYRKCADTVGAVLGRYHPHGDASVYDALVRLAQDFSLRYPLVDGHGNFGSIDGDPPAAYRYTESKMSKLSLEMLTDINKNTVTYSPNYDNRLQEPDILPSRFPNLLVNGSMGIAVGMATNIPPHNLKETINAIQMVIKNPEASVEEIMQYMTGPDFPTGGIIMGRAGIRAAYATGRGKITLRSKTKFEERNGRKSIVVEELPYNVNKKRLIEAMAELVKNKKIDGIHLIRDESDKDNDVRIVIELKKDANENVVLNRLFNYTQLQDSVSVIMLALVNGEPKVLTLKQMIDEYISFQDDVIRRRTQFDLDKAEARAHILEGLIIAADNIDEVVRICRTSANIAEIKERLMNAYGLTEIQADAIAQMRLFQLSNMERTKITDELAELMKKIKDFKEILADDTKVKQIISDELEVIKNKFGDERRTEIQSVSGEVDVEDLIPVEECVVTLTNNGYIKRQLLSTYKTQNRGGKGVSGMKQREEDFVENMFISSSHENILFITNQGNMYRLKCYEIPEGSKQSRGMNIVNLLQLNEGERVAAMMTTHDFADNKYFICVTKNGIVKRTNLSEYKNVRKKGLRAVTLAEGDEIASAFLTEGDCRILVATRNGAAICFDETDCRAMSRQARGVKAIKLRDDDFVVGSTKVFDDTATILTVTDKGMGRRCAVSSYRLQRRGGLGLKNYKVSDEKGYVCGIRTLGPDDDVILISSDGVIIRFRANDMRVMGRSATGVRVMRLGEESRVASFTRTAHDDSEVTEEIEKVSDEEIQASLNEDAAEVVEPDAAPDDDDTDENSGSGDSGETEQ
ncbi:MAG: DNA gyrase subunit A [Oscillospiraceae bacterium]|nr:DNA gyrase subunit A [Oscillospiraceae bacterium]